MGKFYNDALANSVLLVMHACVFKECFCGGAFDFKQCVCCVMQGCREVIMKLNKLIESWALCKMRVEGGKRNL